MRAMAREWRHLPPRLSASPPRSQVDPAQAAEVDASGKLRLGAGNICNHMFSLPFLRAVASAPPGALPFHVARKKVPCADKATGATVTPIAPNGIKLEAFIFDAFPMADSQAVLEVLTYCTY